MTPTETLRAMLDERGVDWDYGITGATTTRFSVNGIALTFTPMRDGLVCSTILTPEKVIAATLGAGTCKPTTYDNGYSDDRVELGEYHEFWEPACACGNCGELIPMRKFCPNCGCRLEVDA